MGGIAQWWMTSSSPASSKSFNESIPKHAYFIKCYPAPLIIRPQNSGRDKCWEKISLHFNVQISQRACVVLTCSPTVFYFWTFFILFCIFAAFDKLSHLWIPEIGVLTWFDFTSRFTKGKGHEIFSSVHAHTLRTRVVPVVNLTSRDTRRMSTMENWGNSSLSTPVTALLPPCQKNTMSSVVYPSVSRSGQNCREEERQRHKTSEWCEVPAIKLNHVSI